MNSTWIFIGPIPPKLLKISNEDWLKAGPLKNENRKRKDQKEFKKFDERRYLLKNLSEQKRKKIIKSLKDQLVQHFSPSKIPVRFLDMEGLYYYEELEEALVLIRAIFPIEGLRIFSYRLQDDKFMYSHIILSRKAKEEFKDEDLQKKLDLPQFLILGELD